jgi:U3 small nucleolar RNA-associated protein 21
MSDGVQEEPRPLLEGLVTLSNLPKSRWHNLQQLDIIKQHNKPKEPPKQPKQAPFFLPTTPGLQPKFTSAKEDGISALDGAGSKILNLGELMPLSEFQGALQLSASVGVCKCILLS